MNVGQFCDILEERAGQPIYRRIVVSVDGKGKKHPRGEKNTMTPEQIKAHRGYPKQHEIPSKAFTHYSIALKHLPGVFCVDIDEKSDKVNNHPLFQRLIGDDCYRVETNKGYHNFISIPDAPAFTNELKVFNDFEGDLLGKDGATGNNIWETKCRIIDGSCIPEYSWEEFVGFSNINVSSLNKMSKKEQKTKVLREKREKLEKKEAEKVDKDPEGINVADAPSQEIIQGYINRIKNTDKHYDNWVQMGIALHTCSGGKAWGRKMWLSWSMTDNQKRCDLPNFEDDLETKWGTFNYPPLADEEPRPPLGWKSLRFWANQDSPLNPYEAHYKEGGISKLVAEMNKELCFNCQTGEIIRVFLNVGKHEDNGWGTFKFPAINQAFKKYTFYIENDEGKKRKANPADLWNECLDRRDVKRIAFDARPDGSADPNIFNIWKGFAMSPEEAEVYDEDDCQPILDHIFDIWCQGNQEHYDYVMNWFSHILQLPYVKIGTLLALQSEQGAGKGIIFEIIGLIMGTSTFSQTATMSNILGDFNGGIEGKVLVDLDEAFWGGEKALMGKMKNLITEKSQLINKKCKEAYQIENTTAFCITTNNVLFAGIEKGDRRHMCLKLDNKYAGCETPESKVYFEGLRGTSGKKGVPKKVYGAFAKVLYTRDLSGFRPNRIPHTDLQQDQIERGWDTTTRWWYHLLTDGTFGLPDYEKEYKNSDGAKKTEYDVRMENWGFIKNKVNGRHAQSKIVSKTKKLVRYVREDAQGKMDAVPGETEKEYIERCYTKYPLCSEMKGIRDKHNGFIEQQVVFQGEDVCEEETNIHTTYKGYYPKHLYDTYKKAVASGSCGYGKAETYESWTKSIKVFYEPDPKRHGKDADGKRDTTWEYKSIVELRKLFNTSQQHNYIWDEGSEITSSVGSLIECDGIGNVPDDYQLLIDDDDI
tara:strand:- start:4803 stop:7589 length:2787 start_codon:yes stop_codon:yes gene_type:complete